MTRNTARLLAAAIALPLALTACGKQATGEPERSGAAAAPTTTQPQVAAGAPLAAGQDKFLGSAYSPPQAKDFTRYWNKVTPENDGKWGEVEAERDVMQWDALDAAYRVAKDNHLPFQMHVMVWGNQQPEWIEALPPAEQRAEIEEWFAAVASRYPDLDFVEVVNEPLHDPPSKDDEGGGNYLQALGGDGATGWDWILESFRLAREHFPRAKLMINEYSVTNDPDATQRYLEIIRLLQAEGLVDAIGIQGHAFATTTETPMSVHRANLDALGATGLPVYVTELDIDGPDDATQLRDYQRIFPVFWEHPAVHGITLWGFRPGLWRSEQGAWLVRADGSERPALQWLRRYVRGEATPPAHPAIGHLTTYDPAFHDVVAPNARIERLADGFTWAEGPAWIAGDDHDGGHLLFTDPPENKLYRWSQADGLIVFLDPSGYAGPPTDAMREAGANGLFAEPGGSVLLADSGNRFIARLDPATRRKTPVATHFDGHRFNSPNDLVRRDDGAVFFTDPPYGLAGIDDSPAKELDVNGVYRLDTDGSVHLLDGGLRFPNGIALSPDQRTLYVSNSDPARPIWMAYTLDAAGDIVDRRVFADASDLATDDNSGLPDGMAVATDGTLFASAPGGVLVLDPDGKRLGRIETGATVTNCTFGDDGLALYMTSDTFIARVRVKVSGGGYRSGVM